MRTNQENNSRTSNDAVGAGSTAEQEAKTLAAIRVALNEGQAPLLDDLKSVWGSREANRAIRELSRTEEAGVHRRRLHKVDGVRYRFASGRVEQKGPARFILTLEDATEAYLTAKSSRQVLTGDIIKAFLAHEDGADTEALPSSLLTRDLQAKHVARAKATADGSVAFFLDNRVEAMPLSLLAAGAEAGDLWFCRITDRGLLRDAALAEPVERIGNEADKGIESELAFATRFGADARCDEKAWPVFVDGSVGSDSAARADIRDIPMATVDGESTSDFDDAIAAKPRKDGGWDVWVAIADVSAFVEQGGAFDNFALGKMTSVYLPHAVHPMLPRVLSTGACSLNPDQDRLALCCKMAVSSAGVVERYDFFRATMRSHSRLTYKSLQAHLDGGAPLNSHALDSSAASLSEVAKALREAGRLDGRLDMGEDETTFSLNENGKIESLKPSPRLWTHKIVEECMLAANRCAAQWIEEKFSTGVFRNHAGLKPGGLVDLLDTLDAMGVQAGKGAAILTQSQIAQILDEAKSMGKYAQARSAILSVMSSANYSAQNTGHYSLVAPHYCHFTSPIRRYADLMVHRLIKAGLDGRPSPYSAEEMTELSARASKLSQKASQAETEARKLLIVDYAKKFQGQTMPAKISTVGERGLWVGLPFPGASLEFFVGGKAMKVAGLQWSDNEQSWLADGRALIEGDTLDCKIEACDPSSRRVELAPVPRLAPQPRGTGVPR